MNKKMRKAVDSVFRKLRKMPTDKLIEEFNREGSDLFRPDMFVGKSGSALGLEGLASDFETIAEQWEEKANKQKDEYFKGQYEGMAMAFSACAERLKQEQARLNRKAD